MKKPPTRSNTCHQIKILVLTSLLALAGVSQTWANPVVLQDFEKDMPPAQPWGVNMPREQIAVKLSTEHPQSGKQCLRLHYKFTSGGEFQYLGVPVEINLLEPATKLHYWVYGDKSLCSYGVQLNDASGETHQFKLGVLDFVGWKEIVIDLDGSHETWGGDQNGQLDYPIKTMVLTLAQPNDGGLRRAAESDVFFDSISADIGRSREQALKGRIAVTSPAYGSEIKGDTAVNVSIPGLDKVVVKCWQHGGTFGADSTVATVNLDAEGKGKFVFPADSYPHGPITVRIIGQQGDYKDTCYLQLYNQGGVSWNEGLPAAPPQVAGMKLIFQDDFKGPLSIGSGPEKTYYDHKPPTGSEDFSFPDTFRNFDSPENPFAQVDTYLRIRADANKKSAGLISSLHGDGHGVKASVPCYFECRFIGPNAPGTWPAFWLMTDSFLPPASKLTDELDIIEAYGGEGRGSPNAGDKFIITPHVWNYPPDEKEIQEAMLRKQWPYPYLVSMNQLGIPSSWYEAPHTYGCLVTEAETTYYCDNIKIGSHQTLPLSKQRPLYFMINLAVGGGWPVDLSRYNGIVDMYVDFVRVYQGTK